MINNPVLGHITENQIAIAVEQEENETQYDNDIEDDEVEEDKYYDVQDVEDYENEVEDIVNTLQKQSMVIDNYETWKNKILSKIWDDERSKQPFLYLNNEEVLKKTPIKTIKKNNTIIWARNVMDENNFAYVRCDMSELLNIRRYIFHRVKRGKYSMKLQIFCKYETNDFFKFTKIDNKTYYVLKNGKSLHTKKDDCIMPTSNRKNYVFLPIAKWQCTRTLCRHIFVKRRIDEGSTRKSLLEPFVKRTIGNNEFAFKE